MRKLTSFLAAMISEVSLIGFGVVITLGFSAGFLWCVSPLTHERYAYALLASTFAGFAAYTIVVSLLKFNMARKISISVAVMAVALAFQVIIPITIERSITVFLLETLSQRPEGIEKAALEQNFLEGYVKGRNMLQKRLAENSFSGNLDVRGDKVLLTRRGRAVVDFLSVTGRLFSVPKAGAPATGTTSP